MKSMSQEGGGVQQILIFLKTVPGLYNLMILNKMQKKDNVKASHIQPFFSSSLGIEIVCLGFNPFKPEFTIVIFIHYKPRIGWHL